MTTVIMLDGDLRIEYDLVLTEVCERIGVSRADARLLHLHSNAIYVLPSAEMVARIATNPAALDRVAVSLRVTDWLAANGFACTMPAQVAGQPFVLRGKVVSLWQYVPAVSAPRASAGDLAGILRDLHSRPLPPQPPAPLADPLSSVAAALDQHVDAMTPAQRAWLTARIGQLRAGWNKITFPRSPGLIHGDAHPGNLMRTPENRIVLGDWDHVAQGPREWDLAQVFYTSRRFGQPTSDDLDDFAAAYGWDPRSWPELPTVIAEREISGLSPYIRNATSQLFSRKELGYRLGTLQANDTNALWNRPSLD